jgi:hypothetical protein
VTKVSFILSQAFLGFRPLTTLRTSDQIKDFDTCRVTAELVLGHLPPFGILRRGDVGFVTLQR